MFSIFTLIDSLNAAHPAQGEPEKETKGVFTFSYG